MLMKLAQRIAINYYRAAIKSRAFISQRKAAEKAFEIFCSPNKRKTKIAKPPIFNHAEVLSFELNGILIRGWRWVTIRSNSKKVLIAHGFNSCSYKFERYVTELRKAGFEVMAFDAPGHGVSGGKLINIVLYKEVILAIEKMFGPLYGIITHSLAGLSASLAAESITSLHKLVLISPATETTTAIDHFFKTLDIGNDIKEEMTKLIEETAKQPVSYFSVNRAIGNISAKTLWLHDKEDRVCPYADIVPCMEKSHPHIEFYITKGLGHNKIYRNSHSLKKIISFLNDNE